MEGEEGGTCGYEGLSSTCTRANAAVSSAALNNSLNSHRSRCLICGNMRMTHLADGLSEEDRGRFNRLVDVGPTRRERPDTRLPARRIADATDAASAHMRNN